MNAKKVTKAPAVKPIEQPRAGHRFKSKGRSRPPAAAAAPESVVELELRRAALFNDMVRLNDLALAHRLAAEFIADTLGKLEATVASMKEQQDCELEQADDDLEALTELLEVFEATDAQAVRAGGVRLDAGGGLAAAGPCCVDNPAELLAGMRARVEARRAPRRAA